MGRVAGGCQASEVVYEADVLEENRPTMTYYGQTKRPFKERWREHKHAMENLNSPHGPRHCTQQVCLEAEGGEETF